MPGKSPHSPGDTTKTLVSLTEALERERRINIKEADTLYFGHRSPYARFCVLSLKPGHSDHETRQTGLSAGFLGYTLGGIRQAGNPFGTAGGWLRYSNFSRSGAASTLWPPAVWFCVKLTRNPPRLCQFDPARDLFISLEHGQFGSMQVLSDRMRLCEGGPPNKS